MLREIQNLYWHTFFEGYWGIKIFRILSRNKNFLIKDSIFRNIINYDFHLDEINGFRVILNERKNFKPKKNAEKAKLRIFGTSVISMLKGLLLNSIPTFLAVSLVSFSFYLPLHFLKNQSTHEIKQTVSTEKFIITQNFLDEVVSSTQLDIGLPKAPTGLRIVP